MLGCFTAYCTAKEGRGKKVERKSKSTKQRRSKTKKPRRFENRKRARRKSATLRSWSSPSDVEHPAPTHKSKQRRLTGHRKVCKFGAVHNLTRIFPSHFFCGFSFKLGFAEGVGHSVFESKHAEYRYMLFSNVSYHRGLKEGMLSLHKPPVAIGAFPLV